MPLLLSRLLALWIAACALAGTRVARAEELLWPLPFGRTLTGGFADSRPDHYHGGVDLRTGPEPREVVAPDDGYVERIAVTPNGYGRTIYFRLADGRTAVFGHLSRFVPPLEQMLRDSQIAIGTYRVDFTLDGTLPATQFRRGDLLCFTGQSGMGPPHLHFEIREGAVQTDPLANFLPRDSEAPVISGLRWIARDEYKPWLSGELLSLKKTGGSDWAAPAIRSDSEIGFFISCYDPGPWGRHAVPSEIRVLLDEQTVYECRPSRIDLLSEKAIYDDLVYKERLAKRDVRRLFQPLPRSGPVANRAGWIATAGKVRIIAVDRAGNESCVSLLVNGCGAGADLNTPRSESEPQAGRFSLFTDGDESASWCELISVGVQEVSIVPDAVGFGDRLKLTFDLQGSPVKGKYFYTIGAQGNRRPLWRIPESGDFKHMSCFVLKSGTYGVGEETTPPRLEVSWRSGRLHFNLTDAESGVDDSSVRCTVNGQTAIPEYEYEEDGGLIWTREKLSSGSQNVDFTASDRAGNLKSWSLEVRIP